MHFMYGLIHFVMYSITVDIKYINLLPLLLYKVVPSFGMGSIFVIDDGITYKKSFVDRKSTRLNSSHFLSSRMPSSA